jgi:hypothetical protein
MDTLKIFKDSALIIASLIIRMFSRMLASNSFQKILILKLGFVVRYSITSQLTTEAVS